MTIHESSSVESWRVYPRVHYFRKRFLDLYPRFKRVIGSLPFNINFDLMWKIDDAFTWYQNDLEMVHVGNAVLPKENTFVDRNAEPQPPHSATKARVCLCYVKGQELDDIFVQNLGHILDYLEANVAVRQPLFCIVDLANSLSPSEQAFVDSYIKSNREVLGRVIFGSGQLEVATTISDYIEENLAHVLGLINECLLSVGIKSTLRKRERVDIKHYYRTGHFHVDMEAYMREYKFTKEATAVGMETDVQDIAWTIETAGETVPVMTLDTTHLSRLFKCSVLLNYCVQKYAIPAKTVNLILEKINYETRFTEHISQDTKNQILKAPEHSKSLTTDSTCRLLGLSIQSEISDVIKDLDDACEATRKTIAIMKKMSFEVNSYLEQSSLRNDVKWISEPPVVPANMRKELLSLDRVYCIGTVYNEFKIYLKPEYRGENLMLASEGGGTVHHGSNLETMEVDDSIEIRKLGQAMDVDVDFKKDICRQQIQNIMKQNGFHYPYAIEVVSVKLSAQLAVGNGTKICSPWPNQMPGKCLDGSVCGSTNGSQNYRFGTLGGIVNDVTGSSFGLTCAHVVSSPYPEHDVFIDDGQVINDFATSSPEMTISFGEIQTFTLVDVAAVKLKKDLEQYCNPYITDDDGVPRSIELFEGKQSDVVGRRVYKIGARTRFTRGLIASADLELPCPDLPGALQPPDSYLIMIDSLPDVPLDGPFSDRGDSGSIVCFDNLINNQEMIINAHQPRTFALSMIHAGELTVDGETSIQSVSFMLKTGLMLLMLKSKVRFT